MFASTRWNPFEDVFAFQREVDRLFNRFWRDLPTRAIEPGSIPLQVKTTDEGWRLEVPMPGVDPRYVSLEVAGNTLTVRVEQPGDKDTPTARYEQTVTVPQFLDVEKITASHRHGLLELTLPLKDSVKPRRIQIATAAEGAKRLTAA
jgi:HSP20 family protein